jgi:hypothetical protein
MPHIQAQMYTSYFGCFVNAAILLEWIQGKEYGADAQAEDTIAHAGPLS